MPCAGSTTRPLPGKPGHVPRNGRFASRGPLLAGCRSGRFEPDAGGPRCEAGAGTTVWARVSRGRSLWRPGSDSALSDRGEVPRPGGGDFRFQAATRFFGPPIGVGGVSNAQNERCCLCRRAARPAPSTLGKRPASAWPGGRVPLVRASRQRLARIIHSGRARLRLGISGTRVPGPGHSARNAPTREAVTPALSWDAMRMREPSRSIPRGIGRGAAALRLDRPGADGPGAARSRRSGRSPAGYG